MSLIDNPFGSLKRLKDDLRRRRDTQQRKRQHGRRLISETLETRCLMAAEVFGCLHNPVLAEDVNNDGIVSAADALVVINAMDRPSEADRDRFTDVNFDGKRSAIDALHVINRMNRDQIGSPQNGPPTRPGNAPQSPVEYRSIDGTGNNLADPLLGSAGQALKRVADADYGDGISTPAGADRPSTREISNLLSDVEGDGIRNSRGLSAYLYVWGQFIDHDMDLTETQDSGEAFPIAVPTGDTSFDPTGSGTATIPLTRSQFDATTGTSTSNPRQQITSITAYMDGSQVYGSDQATADGLRTFAGGRMNVTSQGLLPLDETGMVIAGDIRASENISLTAVQTLFVREHNRLADSIAAKNPALTDEQIYQQARAIVIGEIQSITYNEFLPALLGTNAISRYKGYDASVDPTIANEFSTAAFRFGHSTLNDDIGFFDNNGRDVRDEIELKDAFFNSSLLEKTGIDVLLKYEASSRAQEIDLEVVDSLRNFLFGEPGAGGLDLVALNIQRGRDHGLSDYNSTRAAYGLATVTSFAAITSSVDLQAKLQSLYGDVNNVDLWVGLLAEDHVRGASVGILTQTIIKDQFERLRDGDRFYYENAFKGQELRQLQQTTLADVIERNSSVRGLQQNVFFMLAEAGGRVTLAAPTPQLTQLPPGGRGGPRIPPPPAPPIAAQGIKMELLNSDGDVIDTTVTDRQGNYRFRSFAETGDYQVRLVDSGQTLDLLIKNGSTRVAGLNFSVLAKK